MGLFRRIWALGRRKSVRSENERELREHMEMRIDANVAKGMSPEQAAREARLRFGNPALMRERVDEEDAALDIASFFRDARYAARGFAKKPRFYGSGHYHAGAGHRRQQPLCFNYWTRCGCGACQSRRRRIWPSCASTAVVTGSASSTVRMRSSQSRCGWRFAATTIRFPASLPGVKTACW